MINFNLRYNYSEKANLLYKIIEKRFCCNRYLIAPIVYIDTNTVYPIHWL